MPKERLLTPAEVAVLFRVDPKTVTRWAAAGRLSSIKTPGGHRRFPEGEVRAQLEAGGPGEDLELLAEVWSALLAWRRTVFLDRVGRHWPEEKRLAAAWDVYAASMKEE